eukprot:CAMPEP_0184327804 /NCGR_PEP_ID=MMETSP1049-20130417/143287_1 /TAXON_ID=77928 /ORGANISM="Proteomonas sulcata, Strain CCMP704" /LENGTH=115 /DNA_ID=CAMNT_0026650079 /DNA_START=1215 /DNA_END=1562 /DNA_ORIENTATION=-
MTLLPLGQDLEPRALSPHVVDRIGAQGQVLKQRVDAVEATMLVTQNLDPVTLEKLTKLVVYLNESGMKLMLKVDEINGDDTIKVARKALVGQMNTQLDRLEKLKSRLSQSAPTVG